MSFPAPKSPGSIQAFTRRWVAALQGRSDGSVPCGACHACCSNPNLNVDLTPEEAERFPDAVPMPYEERKQLPRKGNGDCVYLTGGRCSIYDRRPRACRQYDCRSYLLGFPWHETHVDLIDEVASMWGDWRLETADDVECLFAWQRALNETMGLVLKTSPHDPEKTNAHLVGLYLRYRPEAHEVVDAMGLQSARKLAQLQDVRVREMVQRCVRAIRDQQLQAAQ